MTARNPIITLITDFGLADNYVGLMHGVILGIARDATVVDLCHGVPPQDVNAAAFLLDSSWQYFPDYAIHVVVVDPGVGSDRAILALSCPGGIFLAPDNGVLSGVMRAWSPDLPNEGGRVAASALDKEIRVREVTNRSFWLPEVSKTFHGRDIFAPVAAHTANGVLLEQLGAVATSVRLLPLLRPVFGDGVIVAHVVYIDRFGNLITDLQAKQIAGQRIEVLVKGRSIPGLSDSYAEGPELMALGGSNGLIEIARRNGSAAASLQAVIGDTVEVRLLTGRYAR